MTPPGNVGEDPLLFIDAGTTAGATLRLRRRAARRHPDIGPDEFAPQTSFAALAALVIPIEYFRQRK